MLFVADAVVDVVASGCCNVVDAVVAAVAVDCCC